jgi:AraC-like DNA-binding protein
MSPSHHLVTTLSVLNWLLACGGFSIALIGLGELFVPRKRPINYVTAAIGLSFGLAILDYLAQSLGLCRELPALLYLYYPLELLTGTLLFFFFTLLVDRDFPMASPWLLLFLPVLVVTGLMTPYFLAPATVKLAQIPLYATDDPFLGPVYHFIYHNLETWVIAAILAFLVRTLVMLRRGRMCWKPTIGGVLVFSGLVLVALLLYVWANFFPSELTRKVSILASVAVTYPLYFFKQRNVELFGLSVVHERGEGQQRRTKLAGLDTDKLVGRLDLLMREKKLYADSGLSLASLSAELGISPHQLSEILNSRLGVNFRQYLNRFRIEAAMESLRADPGKTILDVAFDCGFGSKSAFNEAFSNVTGLSPREWLQGEKKDPPKAAAR